MSSVPSDAITDKSLSVLHLTEGQRYAGIEAHLANLIPVQAAIGCRVELATFHLGLLSEQLRLIGLEPHLVQRSWKYDRQAIGLVRELLADLKIDILHTHGYLANIIGSFAVNKCQSGRPAHIVTVHGLPEPFSGLSSIKSAINTRLDRWILTSRADRVIAVSADIRRWLVDCGVNEARLSSLSSAIAPIDPDQDIRKAVRRDWQVKPDELIIGFIGRLEPVKRPHLLVDLARELTGRQLSFRLVICGDGPEKEQLVKAIDKHKLSDRFTLLGHRTDVEQLVQGMDLLAIVSQSEGVPISLLEAMSVGVVPVAFSIGGLPEAVATGQNGLLTRPGDITALAHSVVSLAQNPKLLKQMSEAAGDTVRRKFSADLMAKTLHGYYLTTLKDKKTV